jgi:F-type H+-transporting ATPase subunit beta
LEKKIKGRLFNVVGDAIDGIGNLSKEGGYPIHRDAPKFEDLSTSSEVLFTGIKVIDLVEPYSKGGKIGLFGGDAFVQNFFIHRALKPNPWLPEGESC